MAPKKELCRNFMRGSCQYGDRCKFLHVSPQQSKTNPFGFGVQTANQFQNSNVQQQKANPFGFGVQNFQSRGASEFGPKQNQYKPFENKWSRFSPTSAGGTSASRQPDNQPVASSHKCTDPESCKRQIIEDFEHERPLWKLTCYGHSKNGPCDIVGDVSYEELRAAAYDDDAKRGLSLQSIVERERSSLNSKLLEFESLVQNPYKGPLNSTLGPQSPFPGGTQNVPVTAQSSNPPSFSSFSQLASLNTGNATAPTNLFGQSNAFPNTSQTSSIFQMNKSPFGNAGSFGGQFTSQTLQSPFSSSSTAFSNSSVSAEQNWFSTSTMPSQISNPAGSQSSAFVDGLNSGANGAGLSVDIQLRSNPPREKNDGDDSIWEKEDWKIGEIPEEAPPDQYCY